MLSVLIGTLIISACVIIIALSSLCTLGLNSLCTELLDTIKDNIDDLKE